MRILSLPALAAALLLALPTAPRIAEAKAGVLRCQMADGSFAYGDGACSDFGAKAAPLPANVLNRITSEQHREARLTGEASSAAAIGSFAGGRLVPAGGCASSPEQLASHLQASLALGDVNRLAESFDWTGIRHEQAGPIMDRLDQMASRARVVDTEFFEARAGGMRNAGLMQVTLMSADTTRVDDYEVSATGGCYFLHYA